MTMSRPAAVVILAAGAGTRMKSQLPKVLHAICGASMLDHVLAAARELSPAELIVVVGHGRRQVAAHLAGHAPDVRVVVQERQGGTGHAVRTVTETVGLGHGTVVVTYGDTPLLRGQHACRAGPRACRPARRRHRVDHPADRPDRVWPDSPRRRAALSPGSSKRPTRLPGSGRSREINSGVYAFEAALLADSVKRLPTDNAKGEEYLTDVVAILRAEGHHVASVTGARWRRGPRGERPRPARPRPPDTQRADPGRLDARGRDDRRPADHAHRRGRDPRARCRDRPGHPARGLDGGRGGGPRRPGLPAARTPPWARAPRSRMRSACPPSIGPGVDRGAVHLPGAGYRTARGQARAAAERRRQARRKGAQQA